MAISAEEILDNITRYGIEFYRVYPGLYRAIVTANDDPKGKGRVQAHVPSIQEEAMPVWIKAAMPGAGKGRGFFWPPEVGDPVFVSFAEGQPSRPECYIGGWFGYRGGSSDVPDALGYSGDYPDIRGMVTRWGHKLIFSDEDGGERVEIVWNKPNSSDEARTDRSKTAGTGSNTQGGGSASIKITSDGSIEITDNANPAQTIKTNATQGTIEVADKNGNKVKEIIVPTNYPGGSGEIQDGDKFEAKFYVLVAEDEDPGDFDGIDISAVAAGLEWAGMSSTLLPAVKSSDVLLANAIVLLLGIAASLFPAWRASRKVPVEAITRIWQ